MRILGIDPGLNITGYGLIDAAPAGLKIVEAGVIRIPRSGGMDARLLYLHTHLSELMEQHAPKVLALEELYSHYERPTTAILMGHARGVICLAAATHEIKVVSYAATQIKKILTGSGRAPKRQMQEAVAREFRLHNPPEPADVADALAIALCHHYLGNRPAELR